MKRLHNNVIIHSDLLTLGQHFSSDIHLDETLDVFISKRQLPDIYWSHDGYHARNIMLIDTPELLKLHSWLLEQRLILTSAVIRFELKRRMSEDQEYSPLFLDIVDEAAKSWETDRLLIFY